MPHAPLKRTYRVATVVGVCAVLALTWLGSRHPLPPLGTKRLAVPAIVTLKSEQDALLAYKQSAESLMLPDDAKATAGSAAEIDIFDRPLHAAARELVRLNPGVCDQMRKANDRPGLQLEPPWASKQAADSSLAAQQIAARQDAQLQTTLRLIWAAIFSFRAAQDGGHHAKALACALEVFRTGRKFLHAPGGGLVTSQFGARQVHDMATLLRTSPVAIPAPALRDLLIGLNRLDPVERPMSAMLLVEREALAAAVGRQLTPYGSTTQQSGLETFRAAFDRQITLLEAGDYKTADREAAAFRAAFAPCWLDELGVYIEGLHIFHPVESAVGLNFALAFEPIDGEVEVSPITNGALSWRMTEAEFDGLRAGIAIALYAEDTGRAPASLQDLVPAYLPVVPRDPFQPTKALGYREGGLWSVGWDGDDDAGKPALKAAPPDEPQILAQSGDLRLW